MTAGARGSDLILMRLSDAFGELEGLEGAQTHRSWWVAKDGFTYARRTEGRAVLALKDGSEAPVSRTYARALQAEGHRRDPRRHLRPVEMRWPRRT